MGAFVNDITPEIGRAAAARRRRTGGPMKALVVGGAGYIGSVVTRQLLAEGHEVVVLDDCSTGHADAVPAGVELVADATSPMPARCSAGGGFDAVLHFAAKSLVGESVDEAVAVLADQRLRHPGAAGRDHRERRARRWSSPRPRPPTASPSRCRSPRTPPTRPTNTYGATKLAVDMMITGECAATDLAAVSLRYFNVAGRRLRRRRAARRRNPSDPDRAGRGGRPPRRR